MPVEFALRPRIHLRDDFAKPRRARFHLPRFTLHVLGYWLAIAGATYAFIRSADATREAARAQADAPEPAPEATPPRDWWRPVAAPAASPPVELEPAPHSEPQPEPAAAPPSEPPPEPAIAALPRQSEPELPEPAREPQPQAALPAAPRTRELALPALSPPTPAPPPISEPPTVDRQPATSGGGVPSCEAAIAAASQDIDFAHADRTADLPSSALAAVLENGAWLSDCNVPESTSLEVCVAIKNGRVVGASVAARPSNATVAACVRKRATGLHFPYSSHLDIARTRF